MPKAPAPNGPIRQTGQLIVHVVGRKAHLARATSGPGPPRDPIESGGGPGADRHVWVTVRSDRGLLRGADVAVAHGRLARLVTVLRVRRSSPPVRIELHHRSGRWLTRFSARRGVVGLAASGGPQSDPGDHAEQPTSPGALRQKDLLTLAPADSVRMHAVATRLIGGVMLVGRPDPACELLELGGSGPLTWSLLSSGASIAEVANAQAAATGAPRTEVERAVLAFVGSLLEAGVAERL